METITSRVIKVLKQKKSKGATRGELALRFGVDPGGLSGALSTADKEGVVVRLKETRGGRQSVYVLPEFVKGREVATRRKKSEDPALEALYVAAIDSRNDRIAYLEKLLDRNNIDYAK